MQIFFVFDTSFCKSDEDDPKDAVVYFYPLKVCDTQRYELCFQLVGVSQFLKSTFTFPSVVSLDQGKFAFYRSQNYLLVLGGNNTVNSTILKEQLQYLFRIFAFYFKDIDSILNIAAAICMLKHDVMEVCGNNMLLFHQRMKEIWDEVLLTSKFFGNVTHGASNVLPVATFFQKKSSAVRSRAKQLLHVCQRNPPVIAGAIFCEELLVYSQLTPELTRNLMLLLKSQDCAALHSTRIAHRLPPGVKMKNVYLTRKEISSILKHNHMNVGSQIRYQNCKKTPISPCGTASLSSGSEGDVDSGNSSESIEAQKSDTSVPSCSDSQSLAKPEHLLPCNSDILEAYSPHIHSSHHWSKTSGKNLERCISTDTERSYSTAYESSPGNIFDHCRRHSQYLDPTNSSLWKHRILQRRHSFSCTVNAGSNAMQVREKNATFGSELCLHSSSLKTSEYAEQCDLPASGKQHFEVFPPLCRTVQPAHDLLSESCYLCLVKNHSLATELLHKGADKKLQVLKCRLSKRRARSFSHGARSLRCNTDRNSERTVPNLKSRNSSVVENIKDSDLINSLEKQEMFLFVQKYCGCTLFLLLNNSFDEDLLNNLWMYGFSHLSEIELGSRKCMLSANNEKGNDFQIYVLDSVRHELIGNPPSTEDSVNDATMQMMHIDLQSNESLRSVSLISQNRSIVGCSVPQKKIYYMQPGTVNLNTEMSVHREPFTQFYRKAQHRIKKYFGISISEF